MYFFYYSDGQDVAAVAGVVTDNLDTLNEKTFRTEN